MSFLAPAAFGLSSLLAVIVALYFLRLRREERTIASTWLWQEMVRDVAANAPWQKLRPSWLLLLQILVLVALVIALARPFSWATAAVGNHLILVVDTSASMGAADVQPNRLHAAAEQARRLAADLPANVPATLIAAGDEVQILLSASPDRGRLSQALDQLRLGSGGSDMATALELAAAIAAGEPDAQIVVLSDGGVRLSQQVVTAAQVRYVRIGLSGENQAISALSLDPGVAGQGLTAFCRVTHYGQQPVRRRLTLYAYSAPLDTAAGRLVAAHDLDLPAQDSVALTVPDLPPETVAVEARLEGQDALVLDDRAWAAAPLLSGAQIQVVGPGNRFLEMALALLPGVEVTTLSLDDYEAARDGEEQAVSGVESPNWLTVFDGVLPGRGHYPPGALLFIGPLRSTEFFSITGVLELPIPRPAGAGDPVLNYVDLRDVVIQQAARLPLPSWGRSVIVAEDGGRDQAWPLLVVGEADGRRLAVLSFDLRQSDLPLRVAFPLLLANLVDYLAPGTTTALPRVVVPGQALAVPLPPQAEAAVVTLPDETRVRLPAGQAGSPQQGAVVLDLTDLAGVYEVDWEVAGQRWPLGRFAVNLFSALESDIAPQGSLVFAGAAEQALVAERPVRQEWWTWLAWAALVLLLLEWLVQYRGALAWIWTRAARLGVKR